MTPTKPSALPFPRPCPRARPFRPRRLPSGEGTCLRTLTQIPSWEGCRTTARAPQRPPQSLPPPPTARLGIPDIVRDYVDDMTVLVSAPTAPEAAARLQESLDTVKGALRQDNMILNDSKEQA